MARYKFIADENVNFVQYFAGDEIDIDSAAQAAQLKVELVPEAEYVMDEETAPKPPKKRGRK